MVAVLVCEYRKYKITDISSRRWYTCTLYNNYWKCVAVTAGNCKWLNPSYTYSDFVAYCCSSLAWHKANHYCEIIFICWTFNFVPFMGRTIHEFNPTKCWYNLIVVCIIWKSTNSSVQKHVHHLSTMKFHAHERKWFHSICKYEDLIKWCLWCCFCFIILLKISLNISHLYVRKFEFMFQRALSTN